MSPPSFLKTVAYLRKSRADGEESVEEVLARHERMIQDYALRTWNTELTEKQIFREIQSGETIASRPVIQRLIRMIQDGKVEAILCVDLQRLSRGDLIDVGELSRLFLYSGCKILTPAHSYDITDEYDRKFFEMELMHGNDFLEYTKKIMSRGRKQSVLEGNYIGSRAPYGYDKVMIGKRPSLVINPKEAEVVRLIFDLYTGPDLIGPTLIADRLNQMGIPSQRMDHWTAAAVRNVIENPLYIGKVTWDRRKTIKKYVNGQIAESRPTSDEYILVDGKHDPIISQEIWDRAKEAAATRALPSARHDREKIVNPLSGLLVCSECGYMMSFKQCYDYRTKKPINPIFLCTTKGCSCRGSTVTVVLERLRENLISHQKELREKTEENKKTAGEITAALYQTELNDLLRQREKLFEFLERGIYTEEVFVERSGKLNAKIDAARAAIEAIQKREESKIRSESFDASLQKCIDSLAAEAAPEVVNPLLKTVILQIKYHRLRSPDRSYTSMDLSVYFK